jgi:hypothetical protein
MRLRPRHRRPTAAAVQHNVMDVDDGIAAPAAPNAEAIPNHLPGGGQQNIAAPAAPNAEAIPNRLPGGGQQNQAARVAPVLVLRPLLGPATGRQSQLTKQRQRPVTYGSAITCINTDRSIHTKIIDYLRSYNRVHNGLDY